MDRETIIKTQAQYMIKNRTTVRETGKAFGYSKSQVHKNMTKTLPKLNFGLYQEVKKLLEYNKVIRTVRGGESTKIKYKLLVKNKGAY